MVSVTISVGVTDKFGAKATATATASQGDAQQSVSYGNTTVETTVDDGNANLIFGIPLVLPQSGTIQSISFYVDKAAGHLVMGLYDASGPNGTPGKLAAATANFVPTTGWQTKNVLSQVLCPPATYWAMVNPDSNLLTFRKNPALQVGRNCNYVYNGVLPALCPSPVTAGSRWSIYATFLTTVVAPPPPPPPPPPGQVTLQAIDGEKFV